MVNASFFTEQNLCKIINGSLAVVFPSDYREMPFVKRQKSDLENLKYIGFQNTRKNDERGAQEKTVGFFMRDDKFECVCRKPWQYIERLSQYKQTMSPDVSCYSDMMYEEQWYNTFLNRIIGSYWQSSGLVVIPTISWSDKKSYSFAFSGIEKGCIVAVSTIGTKNHYELFMNGFKELCKIIQPAMVVCYCNPYREMFRYANIVHIEYEGRQPWLEAKYRPNQNQLTLFDFEYPLQNAV